MKRILLLFLVSINFIGCASLKEAREYPAIRTETVHKEPFCVYSKLYKAAIEHPASQQSTSCFGRWLSTWDPALKNGEIFTNEPWDVIVLIQVYQDKETTIKIKMEQGIRYCPSKYKQYTEEILSSADFSSCPDL